MDVEVAYLSNAINLLFSLIKGIIDKLYGVTVHVYGEFFSFPTLILGFIFLSGIIAVFWKGIRG